MTTPWLISYLVLWAIVLGVGFLLLGTLRSLGLLQWRFDEMIATRPIRKGREGLPTGKRAPDFTLPSTADGEISLSDFAGRKVLLVFTQAGCGPCHAIAPELNGVQAQGEHQVLVVNHGEPEDAAEMAAEVHARFPIVTQNDWDISKKYQVFATPYAFVVNEEGTIASKGIVGNSQYLRNVLTGSGNRKKAHHEDVTSERGSTVEPESENSGSSKEVTHV
jgi:methylamine dehydrogenase accessory protein MauD